LGNEEDEGVIYSNSYQINPYQVVELVHENIDLKSNKYAGKLGDVDIDVHYIDEQLVFIAPLVNSGYQNLVVEINGLTYFVDFEYANYEVIEKPEEYIESFLIEQQEVLYENNAFYIDQMIPVEEQSVYLAELESINQLFEDAKSMLQTSAESEKLEAAQFINANKADFDQLKLAIAEYLQAANQLNQDSQKEVFDSEEYFNTAYSKFVAARIVLISQARKIITWTAAGTVVGSWFPVIGNSIGAAIGAGIGIGNFFVALQADNIATNQLTQFESIVDEISVDLNKSAINFNNNQKKTLKVNGLYENLNSQHATSTSSNIQQFISYLSIFRNLFNKVNEFLPEVIKIKPKVISELTRVKTKTRPVHSKYLTISNVSNNKINYSSENVDGKIALTFSTEEVENQDFSFDISYIFSGFSSAGQTQQARLSVDVDPLLGLWEAIVIDGQPSGDWRYFYYSECNDIIFWAIRDILHTWEFTETTLEWYAKSNTREYDYTTFDLENCEVDGMTIDETTEIDGDVTLYYVENNVLHVSDGDEVTNFPILSLTNQRLEVMGPDGLAVFIRR
jgi:hypothetical protein